MVGVFGVVDFAASLFGLTALVASDGVATVDVFGVAGTGGGTTITGRLAGGGMIGINSGPF